MDSVLHNAVPVSVIIWVCFFLLPGLLSLVGQMLLCLKARGRAVKFIPFYAAAFILLLVLLYKLTGALSFLIGGFVALLLLGTAFFIVVGSVIVWLAYVSLKGAVKNSGK